MGKLYWKVRKIKKNTIFKVKTFLYKRKKAVGVKKDDMSFEKRVIKEVVKALLRNTLLIMLLLIIDYAVEKLQVPVFLNEIQRRTILINNSIGENRDLISGVLVAIIGIAGVFLGLYCSNIMSMYAGKYANAPKNIARLYETDIVTNRCIRSITSYMTFSLIILFLLVLQVRMGIITILIAVLRGLKIIVSFGFMSRRTFQFSDMYYVATAVHKNIYDVLIALNKGKLFSTDQNFQNHYRKLVENNLNYLEEINRYNLEKEEKSSSSVEEFMRNNLLLLEVYWGEKSSIPYDSFWYPEKVIYKRWYNASDIEITMALNTGALVGYDREKNILWFEEKIRIIN